MTRIESTGVWRDDREILLDKPLSIPADARLKVTIEYDETDSGLARQLAVADQIMAEREDVFRELAK
jgi:hypothetical protein